MDRQLAREELKRFLSLPISTSRAVFEIFEKLPRAIHHYDEETKNFVYVPGTREDRVLLIAHADTVWDKDGLGDKNYEQELFEQEGTFLGTNVECGIGADDRAGCAILWLLRNSGHSLLITDGEEIGCVTSRHVRDNYPELYDEFNNHCYMIQFDRREKGNYKFYNIPVTKEFEDFIKSNTGYYNSGTNSGTDVKVLARDICAVNLSVGYYKEHTPFESIVFEEWLETLENAEKILAGKQKKYPLAR